MGNVTISVSSVPPGFCFVDWQTSFPQLVALISGDTTAAGTFIHVGPTEPADKDQLWLYINAGVPDKLYKWADGVWVAKHPLPPGTSMVMPSTITEFSQLQTYDGGEASGSPPYAGPMWVPDEDFYNRFVVGKGTTGLPSGLMLNVNDVGGEEKHALLLPEIPFHDHAYRKFGNDGNSSGSGGQVVAHGADDTARTGGTGGDGTAANATVAHQNMPPYRVRIWAKRSDRTHYRQA